jgi:murein L,D-transpeptidase YafK
MQLKSISRLIFATLVLSAVVYYFYPIKKLPAMTKIDKLVLIKSEREMHAYSNGVWLKTYIVSLGSVPEGPKEKTGDHKTPEGTFRMRKHINSNYYKALDVSYNNYSNGIEIHGMKPQYAWIGKFQRFYDWTDGCIALTNPEMDELYEAVSPNALIEIKP